MEDDLPGIQKLAGEKRLLLSTIQTINEIASGIEDATILFDCVKNEGLSDKKLLKELVNEVTRLKKIIVDFKLTLMFPNKVDTSNAFLDIQAGSGGIDAQDWAKMLMRMYLKWGERHSFKVDVLEIVESDTAGIKKCTIYLQGKYAYGWLKTETGVHRLVRKSPFDSNRRRHTSFASVFIVPEVINDSKVVLKLEDLRVDTYRSSGAGGQHVNTTDSAVRITHIPTGLVTQCQNQRSQHKNKVYAMKQLKSKLYEREVQKSNVEKNILENSKSDISWGNQIRSYILDKSLVKDLRTGVQSTNTHEVLNGNLDKFIKCNIF